MADSRRVLIKVCTPDRNRTHACIAKSFSELHTQAQVKLGLKNSGDYSFVEEKDGTVFEEDYFQYIYTSQENREHKLMILNKTLLQTWSKEGELSTIHYITNIDRVEKHGRIQIGNENTMNVGESTLEESEEDDTLSKSTSSSDTCSPNEPATSEVRELLKAISNEKKRYYVFNRMARKVDIDNLTDDKGHSVLHLIAKHNRLHLVTIMWRYSKNWEALYSRTVSYVGSQYYGMTALEIAKRLEHEYVAEKLEQMSQKNDSLSAIHNAVRSRDFGNMRTLCNGNSSIANEIARKAVKDDNTFQVTPLFLAVTLDDVEMVKVLVDLGADVSHVDAFTESYLIRASYTGAFKTVCFLLEEYEKGRLEPKLDLVDKYGSTAIDYAAQFNFTDIFDVLARHKAKVTNHTLHVAVHERQVEMIIKISREHKIDVNKADPTHFYKHTPLLQASYVGSKNTLACLEKLGANSYDKLNKQKQSCLFLAADKGHARLVPYLYKKNPGQLLMKNKFVRHDTIYLVNGKRGSHPVWHYVEVRSTILHKFLESSEAGMVNVSDYGRVLSEGWGKEPTPTATQEKDGYHIKNMTKKDVEQAPDDMTPLHVAAFNEHVETVRALLNLEGLTPENKQQMLDARDYFDMTSLHIAAMRGDKVMSELLLENGANHRSRDEDTNKPERVAELNGHKDLAEYLKKYGIASKAKHILQESELFKLLDKKLKDDEATANDLKHDVRVHVEELLEKLPRFLGEMTIKEDEGRDRSTSQRMDVD